MRFLRRLFAWLSDKLFGGLFAPDGPDGPVALSEEPVCDGAFQDRARGRTILFRLYSPDNVEGPAPVVLFSHGLGGSREAAPYLGHALAQNGYFAFFVQHPGSDQSILAGARSQEDIRQRMMQATVTPGNARDRFGDIPFVIDQLTEMNRNSRLAGKLDLDRIGIAGHSYGARNVLMAAGQWAPGYGIAFKEPRIKAGVALSPNVPTGPGLGLGGAGAMPAQALVGIYDAIDIPLFHITGTRDGMPLEQGAGDFDPATRTLPFQFMDRSPQYLLVLDGATHNTFSSRLTGGREDIADMRHTQTVATAAVLFFDAWLKQDEDAREVLQESCSNGLAPGDLFLFK